MEEWDWLYVHMCIVLLCYLFTDALKSNMDLGIWHGCKKDWLSSANLVHQMPIYPPLPPSLSWLVCFLLPLLDTREEYRNWRRMYSCSARALVAGLWEEVWEMSRSLQTTAGGIPSNQLVLPSSAATWVSVKHRWLQNHIPTFPFLDYQPTFHLL